MDETRRAAFQIALDEARNERERIDQVIAFLSERVGIRPTVLNAGDIEDAPPGDAARDVGPVQVADGEFYGMSQTKAAQAFLERAGRSRPQKTEQIIAALGRGGVAVGGKDPGGTLYKILNRHPSFRRVGASLWGLSAWYPNVPRKPAKDDQPETTDSEQEGLDDGDASDGAREPEGTMPPT